jgi:hypothetical protein
LSDLDESIRGSEGTIKSSTSSKEELKKDTKKKAEVSKTKEVIKKDKLPEKKKDS